MTSPHARGADAVLAALGTSPDGLSSAEAAIRLERHGTNELRAVPGVPAWRLALDEARNPLVLVLAGAIIVLIALSLIEPAESRWGDAGLIAAIVVLNGGLGFIQNYRAQRGIEALRRLETLSVGVLRDARLMVVEATQLVPGDIVMVEEGDRISADGRLIRAHDLYVDEASLTGESLPVAKASDALALETPLAERRDMLYMGTSVASGRGRFVVTATGMRSEIGRIAEAMQAAEDGPTPFQREVSELGRRITGIVLVLIAIIAVLQLTVGGREPLETFITAVALAVAAIPEGLPVVLTLALAFGTRRMLERRALVRSLPVVEIIGAADLICTDKTGTITEGRMSLRRLAWRGDVLEVTGAADETTGEFVAEGRPTDQRQNLALLAGAACNNAQRADGGGFRGDPTEVALLIGALKAGVDLEPFQRVDEIPFSSRRRRMSVVLEGDAGQMTLVKGALEAILPRCTQIDASQGARPLTDDDRRWIADANEQLTGEALRVLALAGKPAAATEREEIERDLVFYGLAGIADPPRQAAGPALAAAGRAGVRVVMITGDNPRTAEAVGREIGLRGTAIEGRMLEGIDDDEIVRRGRIFARVEPGHKLRILNAFRRRGHVVIMTGDGVNDAPALKGADVGIAMGARGTDVARDAADMVLLDDNFATIVAAIEEGRRIAANIKKFLNYLLTGNLAEVIVILVASLFGMLPITAVQILWINLVTDSGPAIALAVDSPSPRLMDHPPRRGAVIGRAMLALVGGVGSVIAAIVLATFFIGLALFDLPTAQTLTFTALVVQEYLRLVVIRVHEGASLFANRWLVVAVGVSLALQLVLLYTPLGELFGVVPLGAGAWGLIVAGVVIGFPAALLVTRLVRRRLGPL